MSSMLEIMERRQTGGLARIDGAVPDGTKIVILVYGGTNDDHMFGSRGPISGSADPHTNIEAMRSK
jgi:hypothetical protein